MLYVPIPIDLITVPIHDSIQNTWWFVTSQPITTLYIVSYISFVCMTVVIPDREKESGKLKTNEGTANKK